MTKEVKSVAAKVAAEMIGEAVTEMNGLSGLSLKHLHYFIKYEMKIPKYEIAVDTNKLLIIVSPLLPDESPLFMKAKDETLLSRLAEKIGIPKWTIRFANRADYKPQDVEATRK